MHPIGYGQCAFVADIHKLTETQFRVAFVVEYFDGREVFLLSLAVEIVDVAHLDPGRILKHDGAEVTRGECRVDGPLKALPYEIREVATMIDVRVRQHDSVDFRWLESEVLVSFVGVLTPALVEPAIEQDLLSIDF